MTSNPPSLPRPVRWLLNVPVMVKVMGIALGMAVVLGAGMLWQIHRAWHAHLVYDLEQRGQKLAFQVGNHLAELPQADFEAGVTAEMRHSLAEAADAVYLVLRSSNGVVLAETRLPTPTAEGGQIRELSAPVGLAGRQLLVGMSTARVEREVGWLTRRLALMTALIALVGMTAAWWLSRIFAHPIEELVHLTRAVKTGHYHARATVRAADEVGELAVSFNEMTAALADKEAVRQQLLRRVIRAGEEERKRIARELHDHTGQALTSLIAGIGALEAHASDAAARQRLADMRQQIEQTLSEVHDLSVALRPSVLDDIGLMAALERHCRQFARRSGLQINCHDEGLDGARLGPDVELTIYRVAQETLTNAVRHGQASRVTILVQRTATGVLATIQDDGCGFDARDWQKQCAAANHLGLLGLDERVTLLGGEFCVESAPGQGTTVYAEIPAPASSS